MLSSCTAAVSQSRRRRRRDVTVTCAATSVAVLTVLGLADDVVVAWRRVLNLSTTKEYRYYYTGGISQRGVVWIKLCSNIAKRK